MIVQDPNATFKSLIWTLVLEGAVIGAVWLLANLLS